MKQIWKYPLSRMECAYLMPKCAEILTIQMQDGKPCLWVLVDPDAEKEERYFHFFPTGYGINDFCKRKYIGTFQEERIVEVEKQPDITSASLEEYLFTQKTSKKEYLVFHVFEVLDDCGYETRKTQ